MTEGLPHERPPSNSEYLTTPLNPDSLSRTPEPPPTQRIDESVSIRQLEIERLRGVPPRKFDTTELDHSDMAHNRLEQLLYLINTVMTEETFDEFCKGLPDSTIAMLEQAIERIKASKKSAPPSIFRRLINSAQHHGKKS